MFLAIREFLYTGECSTGATLNCLGIIEAANRFCLPRLVRVVEARVCEDLTEADKEGEDIIEDVIRLLEPAQVCIDIIILLSLPFGSKCDIKEVLMSLPTRSKCNIKVVLPMVLPTRCKCNIKEFLPTSLPQT